MFVHGIAKDAVLNSTFQYPTLKLLTSLISQHSMKLTL